MTLILSGGFNFFGFEINAALFGFILFALLFGGLNLLEYKRFD